MLKQQNNNIKQNFMLTLQDNFQDLKNKNSVYPKILDMQEK